MANKTDCISKSKADYLVQHNKTHQVKQVIERASSFSKNIMDKGKMARPTAANRNMAHNSTSDAHMTCQDKLIPTRSTIKEYLLIPVKNDAIIYKRVLDQAQVTQR